MPVSAKVLDGIDAWWRAANYLSVGQIYLMDNPLLREPLKPEHVKPRLLGHWGTTPGLNFLYAHLNRAIVDRDLDAMYVIGPGHGGPGLVASAYLEGTYAETYPHIAEDTEGMRRLFRQFSFPGGIPSHVAPEPPAPSTRAASSATRWCTPTEPRSTTPTSWWPASSATGRPRPARSRPAGTATSSSTRRATGRCCRSCISTATRSPTRPCLAVRRVAPDLPAVTCFDTAFHADLPAAARTFALPREWRERHDLRRYGFHGLSYAWSTRRGLRSCSVRRTDVW